MIDILFVISVLSVLQHVSIYDNWITIPDKSESIYVVNGFPPFFFIKGNNVCDCSMFFCSLIRFGKGVYSKMKDSYLLG